MDEAKVRLSQKEFDLLTDANWILTKNIIIEKTTTLLAQLQTRQEDLIRSCESALPPEMISSSPKISKGEKYQGLPYLLLDYPRYFAGNEIMAIRTLFWWGNFFSVTLHLSGICKKNVETKIIGAYSYLAENEFYCCINNDQWDHDISVNNYLPVKEMSPDDFNKIITGKNFTKLSWKLSLKQWEEAAHKLLVPFKQLIEVLADQLPRR